MRATLAINGLNEDSDIFEFSNQLCGGFRKYLFYDLGYYYQIYLCLKSEYSEIFREIVCSNSDF